MISHSAIHSLLELIIYTISLEFEDAKILTELSNLFEHGEHEKMTLIELNHYLFY